MPGERHPTVEALGIPDFRGFLVSRFFGVMGRSLLHTALVWHVFDVTREELWLGVLGLVEFLPVIPVAFVAGAVAESRDRRDVVLAARAAGTTVTVLLVLLTGRVESPLALLLLTAFALHLSQGFEFPAGQALLPVLVPREIFQNAVVVSATVRNAAIVSGPVLAGLAIGAAGPRAAYGAAAALQLASVLALLRVRRPGAGDARTRVGAAAVREGLAFLRQRPAILAAMTLDMLAVILADPTVLLAVFSEEILAVGPRGYGVLSGSIAAGTFVTSLLLLPRRGFARPGRALLVAAAAFGSAAVVFGLSRSFPLSVAALVAAGMADQLSQVSRSALIQLSTPNALRGRVNAVNYVFIGASNEFGASFSGFFAAATSAVFATVAGGVACLATAAAIAARVPELARSRVGVEEA